MYSDEGISATSTAKREGFKRMIADALAGKIEIKCAKLIQRSNGCKKGAFAPETFDTGAFAPIKSPAAQTEQRGSYMREHYTVTHLRELVPVGVEFER